MHSDGDSEAGAARPGGEQEGGAQVIRSRDASFRARVVGASAIMLCVALCALAAAGLDNRAPPADVLENTVSAAARMVRTMCWCVFVHSVEFSLAFSLLPAPVTCPHAA
jgi:hypothetical protein